MPRVHHPIDQCTIVHLRMTAFGQRFENTFAYRWATTSAPSSATILLLLTELAGSLCPLIQGMLTTAVNFVELYGRNEEDAVANEATYVFPPNTNGTRGSQPASLNAACGMVKRTGLTGYGQHGRNSFSGFSENDVDGNNVGSALMVLLANIALQILANRVSGFFLSGVAHRPRLIGLRGTVSKIITADVIDNLIDSQKTRLTGHGR